MKNPERNIIYRHFLEDEIKHLRYDKRLTLKQIAEVITTTKKIKISDETVRRYLKICTQKHAITEKNMPNSQTKCKIFSFYMNRYTDKRIVNIFYCLYCLFLH